MKLVYEAMVVATLILTAYLVISVEKNFSEVGQQVVDSQKSVKPLQAKLEEHQTLLELINTELTTFHTEVNTRIAKEEKLKADIAILSTTLSKIKEAEALKAQKEYKKAAEVLKAAKEPIWKAGDVFVSEQAALRGLMWPIDQVIEKWNNNDGSVDTTQISTTIKTILDNIKP
ncbi:MAG: hypothetical protein KAH20_07705 [Methylococcales bacterium]|nr:hypothetical protein [Methylococcales bacterium]